MPKSKIAQNLANVRQGLNVAAPAFVGGEPVLDVATEEQDQDQVEQIIQSTVGGEKSEIDWSAIAADLAQKIENTRSQIHFIEGELVAAKKRTSESREALALLQTPAKWEPSEKFELFHELKKVVDEQQGEQQRIEKLRQIEMAIAKGDEFILQREKQLALLQKELAELEESEEWCRAYAPYLRRFEDAYRHSQEQEHLIRRYKQYLEDSEKLLRTAQEAQGKGQDFASQWARGTIHEGIEGAISAYSEAVEKNRKQLEEASRRDEKRFRAFIKARVDIDASLQEFLKTQQQYQEASTAFFAQLEKHWEPLGLSKDEVFRLASLKLPQIKDSEGKITMI